MEDTNKLTSEYSVAPLGTLTTISNSIGATAVLYGLKDEGYRNSGDFRWFMYEFKGLRLTHLASLMKLEGSPIQRLLGDLVLLKGKERPVYSPIPGMDDVVVGRVIDNPDGLDARQVFDIMHEGLAQRCSEDSGTLTK